MRKTEALNKLKSPLAVGLSAAAVIGLAYKSSESKVAEPTSGPKLEAIYKPAAIRIGRGALKRVMEDYVPGSITVDSDNKGTVDVLVDTSDGSHSYEIFAMMHTKNGEPDPASTFEVLVQEYYGDGKQIKDQILIIDNHQVSHEGTWGAIHNQYSYKDQKHPKASVIAETMQEEANEDLARQAKALAGITLALPHHIPSEPVAPQTTGITV
jgi:hypothetical protein